MKLTNVAIVSPLSVEIMASAVPIIHHSIAVL
ncbi:Uncharacterised protein [Yersinia wautersii]|uniref:Uncharacterized protein n=1 Tax=Yersinia wautersii TaxID=1341643 RepID=A0ABP1ZKD8_9GAMM|nr:Uncharacterised protein [Yersinia wautersii]